MYVIENFHFAGADEPVMRKRMPMVIRFYPHRTHSLTYSFGAAVWIMGLARGLCNAEIVAGPRSGCFAFPDD